MQDFKKLRVWHLARELSCAVTDALPEGASRKIPGLRGQTIRAVRSVAANIAEGAGRATRTEFLRFIEISLSSLNEVDDHLLAARDAAILTSSVHHALRSKSELVRRMLLSLMRALQHAIALDESRRAGRRMRGR